MIVNLAITAVFAVAGYWAGRIRPGRRLVDWAEDQASGPHGPAWWAAQGVGLVAVAGMFTVHPRRTTANLRSWRDARNQQHSSAMDIPRRRTPAPQLDPDWAAKRGAAPRDEDRPA